MIDALDFLAAERLAAFVLGGLVVNLAPGADMVLATACGIQGGPKAGAAAGLGAGTGVLWHVGLAAAGVSALIAAHPAALDILRWVGACYLVWLAWKAWNAGPEGPGQGTPSLWRAWRKGLLTNMLNPKPVLFVLAFLPQFVVAGGPPVWQQIVALGLVFAFTGTLVTMGYGAVAGFAGQALARRMGVVNRLAAVLFAGLALRLATEG
jgi:threonine/homoserine/homoserine lactone efflux protein